LIDGVVITPLKQIFDDHGAVFHMLRADAPHFAGFGEAYFSIANAGEIKSWRRHREMVMSLAVPSGLIRVVLADRRPGSPTDGENQTIMLGDAEPNYRLLTIPPRVWTAFQAVGEDRAIIANCASLPHDPGEVERLPIDSAELRAAWQD